MSELVKIEDPSGVSEARRLTRARALALGLDHDTVERAVLVASEAATNLHRHAQNGRFSPTVSLAGDLVLLSIDDGPGMENPDRMRQDGVSSGSSLGVGLGAMERLSDQFELWSAPGRGTAAISVFKVPGATPVPGGLEMEGLRVNAPRQTVCGDVFAWRRTGRGVQLLLCDGFGHGAAAARDADRIRDGFLAADGEAAQILEALCHVPEVERGAVAMVTDLSFEDQQITAAGVGNISGVVMSREDTRRIVSREGSIGRRCVVRPETYELPHGAMLILHSDGLKTFRRAEGHAHLFYRSSLLAAAVILREALRGRDDASIIVARARETRDG
ncbi:MAG: ATP-binding protein [Oceanicaulis sp.]